MTYGRIDPKTRRLIISDLSLPIRGLLSSLSTSVKSNTETVEEHDEILVVSTLVIKAILNALGQDIDWEELEDIDWEEVDWEDYLEKVIRSGEVEEPFDWNNQNLTNLGTLTAANSIWYREFDIAAFSVSPGVSGATLTPPSANTIGGYLLDAATELLYTIFHIHGDWDAASDLYVDVQWEVNVDNTGGADTDTVDLKLVCYYKGDGETATKTQTIEIPTTVGKSARYKQFTTTFTIDYDLVDNVIEIDDVLGLILNLETDTSEVDNVIINHFTFYYKSNKPAPEVEED